MSFLTDTCYSQEECIDAVRDFYSFLTQMYLEDDYVKEPPESGWPSITSDILKDFGKTDEVISLHLQLPYIHMRHSGTDAHGAPWCYFADWQSLSQDMERGRVTGYELKLLSEGADIYDNVPPHVVSLTLGDRDDSAFLLDTKLGIVYWHGCPGEIMDNPSRERIWDDPYEWAPENEADWRGDASAWTVKDFFGVLKDQFITLSFIPMSPRSVIDIYTIQPANLKGLVERLQETYRSHDWPELESFCKHECLAAVEAIVKQYDSAV
ncbi:hypothetical protein CH063_01181 [Colletotrichum higginsianum]|uniref:Alpha beta hydrolase fold protein n=1 Tax=Colletotrichum higginsianum (strain IMI 349063) TaxID=759273 RepID=H1V348_COLHI|nr:Alpha beta hydrolase fold protein [Colletotrichum higginsianum IMI 349063]OBR02254.1 Alpha beta hydrolase fold protein [Colletotrichum higginsianum IMI 349063]CCF34650.1 hypothetical protein CH063_01181 [Colletotrichum higginsianum]